VSNATSLLLLTDYDGTLTPIAPSPERARLSTRVASLLHQLNRAPDIQIGVVSGRALQDVRRLVGLPGLIYVGNHGMEIAGAGLRFLHPRAKRAQPVLRRIRTKLRGALRTIPGSRVEWKGLSLSIHWRLVRRAQQAEFQRAVRDVLEPWIVSRRVRMTAGKRVVEVRPPVDWDKGQAAAWIVRHSRHRPSVICYIGDDQTDEDAFRVVNRLRGLTIFIGSAQARTRARWRLDHPTQVRQLLRRILTARTTDSREPA